MSPNPLTPTSLAPTRYKEEQQDLSMTTESTLQKSGIIIVLKMINDLGWRDPTDRRRDKSLIFFYKIATNELNATSEGVLVLAKGEARQVKHTINVFLDFIFSTTYST